MLLATEATWALILAAWREGRNRHWRFSRAKAGLWLLLAQLGAAALAAWRLAGHTHDGNTLLLASAISLQAGVGSFLGAFQRGKERLYSHRFLPLVHVSPVSSTSVIMASIGADLPGKAWSALLLSAILGVILSPGSRMWGVPLLWTAGLVAGLLGQLLGLMALVFWARAAPGTLGMAWAGFLGLQLGVLGYLAYLLGTGLPLEALAGVLKSLRRWLFVGVVVLLGLPRMAIALRLTATPQRYGEVYREGWLNLAELADAASGPRRSRWPTLAPGSAGAIQAKEWLLLGRNRLSLIRLALWTIGSVGLVLAGPLLGQLAPPRQDLVILGLALALTWLCYGEVMAALFSTDRPHLILYIVAGVPSARLLAGKLLAMTPFVLFTALSTWTAGLAAGKGAMEGLSLALAGGGQGLGMAVIMVGMAAIDAVPRNQAEEADSEVLTVLFEQIPRGIGGWSGLALSVVFAMVGAWIISGVARVGPLVTAALFISPVLALVPAYLRLRQLLNDVAAGRANH
ncbi:MAG: hypothetical protein M1299_04920 [Firmicutes bacterium]|nr:hypothetical protein [Bacillota bacterium]